jgi:hypothetical protein
METPYFKLPLILLIAISWIVTDKASGQDKASGHSSSAFTPETDTLYVSNAFGDAPVIGFNAASGVEEISFVSDANATIIVQHGVLVAGGELILVNQNATEKFAGNIQQFLLRTGKFAGFLVPHENSPGKPNPDAPWAPNAALLIKGILFVSDLTGDPGSEPNLLKPGAIYVFKGDGTLLKKLDSPSALATPFHPRGMVLNPRDGLLYVSNCPNAFRVDATVVNGGNGGQVLKFDPSTLEFKGVFIDDPGGVNGLNRPDGLVFGPDGNLYVTSFRFNSDPVNPAALDSIRVYNRGGQLKDSIPLDIAGQPRSFAQAILFGPDGKLFVPISGNDPATTGQIRRYDVSTKKHEVFVKNENKALSSPQYLTFGRTDPATLAYGFQ